MSLPSSLFPAPSFPFIPLKVFPFLPSFIFSPFPLTSCYLPFFTLLAHDSLFHRGLLSHVVNTKGAPLFWEQECRDEHNAVAVAVAVPPRWCARPGAKGKPVSDPGAALQMLC